MTLFDWIELVDAADAAAHPTRLTLTRDGVLVVTGRTIEGRGYANCQSTVPWSRLDCLLDPKADILRTIRRNSETIDKELKLCPGGN